MPRAFLVHRARVLGDSAVMRALKEPFDYRNEVLLEKETLDGIEFDLAVATFWDTVPFLWRVPAKRQAYFVQSLEDRFHHHDEIDAGLDQMLGALEALVADGRRRGAAPSGSFIPSRHFLLAANIA